MRLGSRLRVGTHTDCSSRQQHQHVGCLWVLTSSNSPALWQPENIYTPTCSLISSRSLAWNSRERPSRWDLQAGEGET